MSAVAPSPHVHAPSQEVHRLTRWSLLMVPLGLVVWVAVGIIAYASLGLFGLSEGDLILMAQSVAAWIFDLVLWAILAAAPVAGVVLAAKALRRGGHVGAWAGLVLNGLVALVVAYQVFDEIRMSYFPGFTWPFG